MDKQTAPMRLIYLAANQQWAFAFGDALIRMGQNNKDEAVFFPQRYLAVHCAHRYALDVHSDGSVTAERTQKGDKANFVL